MGAGDKVGEALIQGYELDFLDQTKLIIILYQIMMSLLQECAFLM